MKQEELEKLFIGSILKNPDGLATVLIGPGELTTEHGLATFQAAFDLFRERKPVNLQSVAMVAGWQKYTGWLSEAEDLGTGSFLSHWAEEIQKRAAKVRIKSALAAILKGVEISSVPDILEELRGVYSGELVQGAETGTIHEAMLEFEAQSAKYREAGNIGITTGFTKWDKELITYEPGHLWAIGGFTSVGKTATALEFVGRIGANKGLAVFSMEMTKPQIVSRMLSRLTGDSSRRILSGKVDTTELFRAKEHLSSQPLYIYRKTRKWDEIRNACRVLKIQGCLDVAVFDYQQNISAEGKTTHDKMEYISRSAQDMCQELEITGVMLSQISLQQAREDSGNPEFKGGGGLAECADIALHLSRPTSGANKDTELIVEMRKNRHGKKVNLLLTYCNHYTRLEEQG